MVKAKEDIYELIERNGFNDSVENLREVFGKRAVNEALNKSGYGYINEAFTPTVATQFLPVPHREIPSWTMNLSNSVSIAARFKDEKGWHTITRKTVIPKNRTLQFIARTNVKKPFSVHWQVVNTGEEAKNVGGLRGGIFSASTAGAGGLIQKEHTGYTGTHWIECFIVKNGICVARSNEFFVKVA